ncbi:Na-translocating system protein MpsC family protein [Gracilibacillus phocaeensis]|uniref:Na-translocating system protein MpsC family protein n=1 Tax=Gracilibacillus phocaeensis TaxID=2042304 RepID=UPI0010327044|nr:Na-translocating system protein MpsC family protein [Gracilibacillus phocaeensis]
MEKTVESGISSAIGKLFRTNFGKGPESIFVSLSKPYITIYLRKFLAPMEKVILKQESELKFQETRDMLMKELTPHIQSIISSHAGVVVDKIYYDWSIENENGIIFAELDSEFDTTTEDYINYPAKQQIHEEINRFTQKAQKFPRKLTSFMLNARTLISRREDIFVLIEQELIQSGFENQLRLSKRKLEKSLIDRTFLESVLQQEIQDLFVDWDFKNDIGFVVFILM